ncbi:MAG: hypothetical protein QOF58_6059 [Pseudonocardiales bacterium]|nr:hypothetical protein [Pseudonocardiales bacterium]
MRAVVVSEFAREPELVDVPDPEAPHDGVVVAVEATGLCRSDWHGWMGHDDGIALPHVPGHELAGTVIKVGRNVRLWAAGDRVTVPFVLACGDCRSCARGDSQVCERQEQPGFTRWGSFADQVALPRADVNLVRVPSDVESDVAASLGCRFATAYRAVAQVAGVSAGDNVVVHGCGGVGLSAIMVAVALGARVLAVDVAPASLELAEQLGALPVAANDVAALPDLTDGGADVSLDAFGSRATLSASVACLRPRGRHVQVGLLGGDDAAPRVDMSRVVAQELQLLGSHGMAASAYPEMLALVAAGRLRPQQLLRERISLEEAGPRLAILGEPGAGTGGITVIRPDQS